MELSRRFSLRVDEPVCAGIQRVCEALLKNAVGRISPSAHDREEDIHAVRTSVKHVRALLRLLKPMLGVKAFQRQNQHLKKTAQLLSSLRDRSVGSRTLQKLANDVRGKNKRRAFAAARTRFSENTHPLTSVQKQILGQTRAALELNRRQLLHLQFAADGDLSVTKGLEKVYRASRQRWRRAFSRGDDESFHRWRIRLKNLYYEMQFLLPVWPKGLGPMIAQLKQVQELIGDDHDLTVLKEAIKKTPEHFGGDSTTAQLLRAMNGRSRELRRACRPIAEKCLGKKPRRFIRQFEQHWAKWQTDPSSVDQSRKSVR